MSNIIPFQFEKHSIIAAVNSEGTPVFVAKSIADALEYSETHNAMKLCKHSANLAELNKINNLAPATKWIPESDVYRLIMRSNMPNAERFQDWVTEEVLPSIRKTGSYSITPTVAVGDLDRMVRSQIGGIVKAVLHKEVMDAIHAMLPELIHGSLSKQQTSMRHGVTAGQVWNSHGLPKLKGAAGMLSHRLEMLGCLIDGGGRGELGGKTAKLFDPDKAGKAMKCGLLHLCQAYAEKRLHLGQFQLIDENDKRKTAAHIKKIMDLPSPGSTS